MLHNPLTFPRSNGVMECPCIVWTVAAYKVRFGGSGHAEFGNLHKTL